MYAAHSNLIGTLGQAPFQGAVAACIQSGAAVLMTALQSQLAASAMAPTSRLAKLGASLQHVVGATSAAVGSSGQLSELEAREVMAAIKKEVGFDFDISIFLHSFFRWAFESDVPDDLSNQGGVNFVETLSAAAAQAATPAVPRAKFCSWEVLRGAIRGHLATFSRDSFTFRRMANYFGKDLFDFANSYACTDLRQSGTKISQTIGCHSAVFYTANSFFPSMLDRSRWTAHQHAVVLARLNTAVLQNVAIQPYSSVPTTIAAPSQAAGAAATNRAGLSGFAFAAAMPQTAAQSAAMSGAPPPGTGIVNPNMNQIYSAFGFTPAHSRPASGSSGPVP